MDSYKEVVAKWPVPQNRTQARAFMGKVGYYRKFIKNFAATPVHGPTSPARTTPTSTRRQHPSK